MGRPGTQHWSQALVDTLMDVFSLVFQGYQHSPLYVGVTIALRASLIC